MFRTCFYIFHRNKQNSTFLYRNFCRNISNITKDHNERQTQKLILQENLGLSYQRCAILLRTNKILQTIDNKKFEDTVKCLKKMGIHAEDIYENPMTLSLHQNTIEHNIKYLQEAGFTYISAQILLKFRTVVKKPVSLLKAHGVIPEDINVPERLFSYLFPKPSEFPILQKFTDEDNIVYIHETIFKHYLVWRLDSTPPIIDRIFRIYDKFKYKSFDLISHMIQILTKELKYTNQKLLQNGYLFQNGPDFLREILTKFPVLAGVDIKTVLFRYPKIAATPPDNIAAIDKQLKKFGISNEAISKCFDIYTLSPDTVLYRLEELKRTPEFQVLLNNSRIVRLVLCQNKAKLRLEHLQKLKVKCASINVLCASDTVFEKYAQEGNDRTKGSDLINYISSALHVPEKSLRNKLSCNPNWCHVPLLVVQNTLEYLLNNQLPKSAIGNMPTILLYPKKQISDALLELDSDETTSKLRLNSREKINLCLYFIERKHHFSGDGVWGNTEPSCTSNIFVNNT